MILPAVEEIVQAQGPEVIAVDNRNIAEEQVLAMDDVTDSDEDIPPPPLVPPVVEINIPFVQNPQNFLVDVVPLEDLIPFDDLVPQPRAQPDQLVENIQLGFVETYILPVDPMMLADSSLSKGPSPATIRCWAKHFFPLDRTKPTVTILTQWMDFFSLLLLKPGSFEWA